MKRNVFVLFCMMMLLGLSSCGTDTSEQPLQTESDASLEDTEALNETAGTTVSEGVENKNLMEKSAVEAVGYLMENGHFSGRAWGVFHTLSEYNLPMMALVTFEPGCINDWHTHAGGQVLIVTGGMGYYQEEGKPVQVLQEGDVVQCPAEVKHWHGASPESWFAHIAVETNPEMGSARWYEEVSAEEYSEGDAAEPGLPLSIPVGEKQDGIDVWRQDIVTDKFYNLPDISYVTIGNGETLDFTDVEDTWIAVVTRGSADIGISGADSRVSVGDRIVLPVEESIQIKEDGGGDFSFVMIKEK